MTLFALVDCNNFYASCERAFNPALEGKPIVVLSNNDGCVIARSNEAKKLGIPMGAPFFKWEKFCRDQKVVVFSSNYELYGDMSQRVMSTLTHYCPDIEIYSIDEAFLSLDGFLLTNILANAIQLRHHIKTAIGLPVSIGIAATKTLAKVANQIAKQQDSATGVFCLDQSNINVLQNFPVEKLWGIGRQFAARLKQIDIHTAEDLKLSDPKFLRSKFNVLLEKMIYELRGISCLALEQVQAPRKQIISSRSFGKCITDLTELEEAISHYAAIASAKLRHQHSLASALSVFVNTNFFRPQDSQYQNSVVFPFPMPTADTSYIIQTAKKCLQHIYRKHFRYHKTGIMLLDLLPDHLRQFDLLNAYSEKSEALMKTLDRVNQTYGKNTLYFCAEGVSRPWQLKRGKLSPRYTTRWKELLIVR